jgi:hypothetical protein
MSSEWSPPDERAIRREIVRDGRLRSSCKGVRTARLVAPVRARPPKSGTTLSGWRRPRLKNTKPRSDKP